MTSQPLNSPFLLLLLSLSISTFFLFLSFLSLSPSLFTFPLSLSTPSLCLFAVALLAVQFVSRKVRAVIGLLPLPEITQNLKLNIIIATTTMMYYLAMRSFLYIETLISDLSVFTSDGITTNLHFSSSL